MTRFVIMIFAMLAVIAGAAEVRIEPGDSIDAAATRLKAGDTLVLAAGDYRQSVTLSGLRGTAEQPIVIRGEEGAVIRAVEREGVLFWGEPSSHVVLEGLTVKGARRAGIIVSKSSHITIRGCTIADNGSWGIQTSLSDHVTIAYCDIHGSRNEHGIYFSTTDQPVVRNCRIHDNAACGIHLNGDRNEGGDGMITGALIEGNVIYANGARGGAAINMDGVERAIVRDNLIYDNLAGGIVNFVQNGAACGSKNQFRRNTVFFRRDVGRFGLRLCGPSRDAIVLNNVLVCGEGPALSIDVDARQDLVSEENVLFGYGRACVEYGDRTLRLDAWRGRTQQDQLSVCVSPAFVDPKKGHFRLRDSFVERIGFEAGVGGGVGVSEQSRG